MSISDWYNKTATVERLSTVSGNKKGFDEHLVNVKCHIQPLTDENNQDIQGGFGRELIMLSAIVDIAEGDRVIVDSETYRVVGTEALNIGLNPHRETRLRIFKSS